MANEEATNENKVLTIAEQIEAIKDTPEFAAILNQHGKTYHEVQAEAAGAGFMGKAYNIVDGAYLEGLGLKERPKGKTSELVLAMAKEHKAMTEKLKGIVNTPDTTEENKEVKQLHDNRVSTLEQQIAALKTANEDLQLSKKNQSVKNNFSKETSKMTFNPALSSSVLDEVLDSRTKRIVNSSKEVEGKTIFYNDNNEPYTNLNGLPMSAKEVANEVFKDLISVKKEGGNAPQGEKPSVKGDVLVLPNPELINSFGMFNKAFQKAMASKGWASHEQRYIDLQRATQKHYFPKGLSME